MSKIKFQETLLRKPKNMVPTVGFLEGKKKKTTKQFFSLHVHVEDNIPIRMSVNFMRLLLVILG